MDFIVLLPAKIQVCIITFSSEKVISSESGEKSVQIKHCYKPKQVNTYVGGFWCERTQMMDFFTGGSVMDYGLVFWRDFLKWKHLNAELVSYKHSVFRFIYRWTGVLQITCRLLWCFYQLFGLSFWRHPFTEEDPLVSKWYNATFL